MPSMIMAFPPGARMRTISAYAFSGWGRFHRTSRETTRSKDPSSNSMFWASILRKLTFIPFSAALDSAFFTISSE